MILTEPIINNIITALSAFGGVIIGGLITYKITMKQIKAENQRFLIKEIHKKRICSLSELYELVVECKRTLNFYGNVKLENFDEFKTKVLVLMEKYELRKEQSEIWLDDNLINKLDELMGFFRKLRLKLYNKLDDKEKKQIYELDDWIKLTEVRKTIKKKLHSLPEFQTYFKFLESNNLIK